MAQPTLQKISLKEAHESFSGNSRGHVHEDQRLQIEKLDEWRAHKLRTPDKPKLRQNEPDTSPNQLKIANRHYHTECENPPYGIQYFSIRYGGGVFAETRPSTRACLRPCENRAKDFSSTGYD
ncbi:hypothetical protein GOBAR_AA25070 [Gossypium barbadense]|uniref:Uncharacterized protein n=1 Tax=Gossypium barbadense TaxID=3634 RepID=A0A2P5WX08_GOSBA|nr:hypothetical protein GOBAR_AA25070 [Gossypium barbadense]